MIAGAVRKPSNGDKSDQQQHQAYDLGAAQGFKNELAITAKCLQEEAHTGMQRDQAEENHAGRGRTPSWTEDAPGDDPAASVADPRSKA